MFELISVEYAKNFKWYEPPLVMDKETNMQILSKARCMEIRMVRKWYPHLPAGWSRLFEVQKLSNGKEWSRGPFIFKDMLIQDKKENGTMAARFGKTQDFIAFENGVNAFQDV